MRNVARCKNRMGHFFICFVGGGMRNVRCRMEWEICPDSCVPFHNPPPTTKWNKDPAYELYIFKSCLHQICRFQWKSLFFPSCTNFSLRGANRVKTVSILIFLWICLDFIELFEHADVNECLNARGGCEHQCVNSEGTYECVCNVGYRLSSNGRSCYRGKCFQILCV